MTRYSARSSARYSGTGSVAVGNARQDVDVALDVAGAVAKTPPADAAPRGGPCLRHPYPTYSVVTEQTQVHKETTERAHAIWNRA